MMSLHLAGQRLARAMGSLLEKGQLNAGDVVLSWDAAAAPADPNLEAGYVAPSPSTMTVRAFIHYVQARTISRGYTDMQAGDAIITFDAGTDLSGKRGLVFALPPDGKEYVQAGSGKQIAEFWDVIIGGEALTTTLLLRQRA